MTNDSLLESPRAAKSVARRQHLLDTARNLFIDRGFHQTGMAQIAAASGVAVGQIYRDFANKEAIVSTICLGEMATWLDEQTLTTAVAEGDRDAILAWLKRVSLQPPDDNKRRMMCELLAEVGRNPAISESSHDAQQHIRASLDTALRSLAPDAPRARRAMIIDMIVAFTWGVVALREISPGSDYEALHRRMGELLRAELEDIIG